MGYDELIENWQNVRSDILSNERRQKIFKYWNFLVILCKNTYENISDLMAKQP